MKDTKMTNQGSRNLFRFSADRSIHEHKRTKVAVASVATAAMLLGGGTMVFARAKNPPVAEAAQPSVSNGNIEGGSAPLPEGIGDPGDAIGSTEPTSTNPSKTIANTTASKVGPVIVFLTDVAPDDFSVSGIGDGSLLNVRSGPGTHNTVVALLPADANGIQATGRRALVNQTEWRQVQLDGIGTGWVAATYLAPARLEGNVNTKSEPYNEVLSPAPRIEEPRAVEPDRQPILSDTVMLPSEAPGIVQMATPNGERAVVRAEPGNSRTAVSSVAGSAVNVTTTGRQASVDDELWIELNLFGTNGWVKTANTIPAVDTASTVIEAGAGAALLSVESVEVVDGTIILSGRDFGLSVDPLATAANPVGDSIDLPQWAEAASNSGSTASVEVVLSSGKVVAIWIH